MASRGPRLELVAPKGEVDAVKFASLYTAALIGFAETKTCNETKPLADWVGDFSAFMRARAENHTTRKGTR